MDFEEFKKYLNYGSLIVFLGLLGQDYIEYRKDLAKPIHAVKPIVQALKTDYAPATKPALTTATYQKPASKQLAPITPTKNKTKQTPTQELAQPLTTYANTKEYDSLIGKIREDASSIEQSYMADYLNQSLEQILKQWEGTRWGMYGDSLKPKTGRIACGYLGIRAMEALGYEYNPDDLGWQTVGQEGTAWLTAEKIIKASCSKIQKFWGKRAFNKVKSYLKTQQDGFYMVGLDRHFGFLQKKNDELYFIHSNEKPHGKVIKEKADEVSTLKHSYNYVIGKLFTEDTTQQYFQREHRHISSE